MPALKTGGPSIRSASHTRESWGLEPRDFALACGVRGAEPDRRDPRTILSTPRGLPTLAYPSRRLSPRVPRPTIRLGSVLDVLTGRYGTTI